VRDPVAHPDAIETWRGIVAPEHIDLMGHMNVAWYAAHFSEATLKLFEMIGIDERTIREQQLGMAALEQHLRYIEELFAGTPLLIRSAVTAMGGKSLCFVHEMYRSGAAERLAAQCEFTAVCFDLRRRSSCPIPDAVRAAVLQRFTVRLID